MLQLGNVAPITSYGWKATLKVDAVANDNKVILNLSSTINISALLFPLYAMIDNMGASQETIGDVDSNYLLEAVQMTSLDTFGVATLASPLLNSYTVNASSKLSCGTFGNSFDALVYTQMTVALRTSLTQTSYYPQDRASAGHLNESWASPTELDLSVFTALVPGRKTNIDYNIYQRASAGANGVVEENLNGHIRIKGEDLDLCPDNQLEDDSTTPAIDESGRIQQGIGSLNRFWQTLPT